MYDFHLEVNLEEAVTLNQVEERVKEQGRVWWAYEANRGVGWYLSSQVALSTQKEYREDSPSSIAASFSASLGLSSSSLSFSDAGNAMLLKKLIRKGIPPLLRPKVWKAISGAAKKKGTAPDGYYLELLREVQGRETKATRQIDNDLHRTFPGHSKIDSPEGLQSLRRILVAYSWRDSRVGYCQGMNFVAAYLLLVMRSEEEAFWMLATLLEEVLYDDCFSEDLSGTHVEQRVLQDLLVKKLPKLAAHLNTINFEVSLVTTEWFLCLFARSFPTETTMRIWDVLFSEGAKVLFRVAIAIFKMREDELLKAQHLGEAIRILQNATHHLFDPDVLLKVAFDKLGTMSMTAISKQRQKQQPAVMAELEERQKNKFVLQTSCRENEVDEESSIVGSTEELRLKSLTI